MNRHPTYNSEHMRLEALALNAKLPYPNPYDIGAAASRAARWEPLTRVYDIARTLHWFGGPR